MKVKETLRLVPHGGGLSTSPAEGDTQGPDVLVSGRPLCRKPTSESRGQDPRQLPVKDSETTFFVLVLQFVCKFEIFFRIRTFLFEKLNNIR